MPRLWLALLVGLAVSVAAQAREQPKDKSPPAEQYKALAKEYDDAQQAFFKAYQEAKTEEERDKLYKEKYPDAAKFAARFMELAEKNPKDPAAIDALVWVVTHVSASKDSPRTRALELLGRDYADSDKLGPVCQNLTYSVDKESEQLLRAILEKNSSREVQGQACMALGQFLKNEIDSVRGLKGNEETRKRFEQAYPAEDVKRLQALDPDKLEKEAEEQFKKVVAKYGDVKHYRDTLGKAAEGELYEMKFLAVGKEAPEVEGEDVEGKKFKLSDYRGKVVLLDFWGHW